MPSWPCDCCDNGVNLWTPERIQVHLRSGKLVPTNWRTILDQAGITIREPEGQLTFPTP